MGGWLITCAIRVPLKDTLQVARVILRSVMYYNADHAIFLSAAVPVVVGKLQ